jgi:TM2 domain-containing membrane protein YozV
MTEDVPGYRSQTAAYVLWFGWVVGLCGLHRFYLKRYISGIIWLLTFGLFFIGQFIDLFLIPGRVEEINARALLRAGRLRGAAPKPPRVPPRKLCPDCGESIAAAARVCRHCGADLSQPHPEDADAMTLCGCPECNHILEVPNHLLGVPGKCHHCGQTIIPMAVTARM